MLNIFPVSSYHNPRTLNHAQHPTTKGFPPNEIFELALVCAYAKVGQHASGSILLIFLHAENFDVSSYHNMGRINLEITSCYYPLATMMS